MKKSQLTTNQFLPYYSLYVNLVGDIHIEKALTDGMLKTVEFFEGIPSDKASFAYEDGKWTSKEILLHLIDTERVFSYRALSISRSSVTNLPSFDQDEQMIEIWIASSKSTLLPEQLRYTSFQQ
jgi:hypothetical protein